MLYWYRGKLLCYTEVLETILLFCAPRYLVFTGRYSVLLNNLVNFKVPNVFTALYI